MEIKEALPNMETKQESINARFVIYLINHPGHNLLIPLFDLFALSYWYSSLTNH